MEEGNTACRYVYEMVCLCIRYPTAHNHQTSSSQTCCWLLAQAVGSNENTTETKVLWCCSADVDDATIHYPVDDKPFDDI